MIDETSPYLLQHADNPVDWWPWCKDAFDAARQQDKPVFLSIGYSTCHWCHVMAHESFENEAIAALLNRDYISIKVDREERPDIDHVYMSVCQAMTGGGGWPLTIVMTPDRQPFYAGTYLPPREKWGRIGLDQLLERISAQWKRDRSLLVSSACDITAAVAAGQDSGGSGTAGREPVEAAFQALARSFDPRWGGFGPAPKFPMPHNLMFLLRYHALTGEPKALDMTEATLQGMMAGGIFDHIGGGFSRYSTDDQWLAPHFEKMLYDNALLAMALAECGQATGKEIYSDWACRTLEYVVREMRSPEGGFYSAQDADSDGVEGKYYIFTPEEVQYVLGPGDSRTFCGEYNITPAGNFEGKSIPNLIGNPQGLARWKKAAPMAERLYQYRLTRTLLHKDDKCLTAWNALMIAAFATAGRILNEPHYLTLAREGLAFVDRCLTKDGRLGISFRRGSVTGEGLLEDHAFLTWACLTLYEADYDPAYLQRALSLAAQVTDRFSHRSGGFFVSPKDGEALLFRPKDSAE